MNNRPIIKIENLTYTYPDGPCALNDINLNIYEGEKVALAGRNGAGKSTLLLAIGGFIPFSGKIFVAGKKLMASNIREIRKHIGFVFQNPDHQLFMPTVEEDVAFGPLNMNLSSDEIARRVTQALSFTQTTHLRRRSPHHLSIGEKHRVAIATVLSMNPDILILDEPSASLDPSCRRKTIELLKSMNKTMIIAGHDLPLLLEVCNRALIMDNGKVTVDSEPQATFTNTEIMKTFGLELPYLPKPFIPE